MTNDYEELKEAINKLEKRVAQLENSTNSRRTPGLDKDDLFDEAVKTVSQYNEASSALLQRRLMIGYARAARILDELEEAGIVGSGEGAKPRKVLISKE
ncbi:MAG: DNA translocase FtsK [Candidatus Daviesbacteria bacterium]|nr:DNA translocase FtsK [Candidatus Daviesbacteria bacterium]